VDDPFVNMSRSRKTSGASVGSNSARPQASSSRYPQGATTQAEQHRRSSYDTYDSTFADPSTSNRKPPPLQQGYSMSSSAPITGYGTTRYPRPSTSSQTYSGSASGSGIRPGTGEGNIPFPQPAITPVTSTTPWSISSKRLPATPASAMQHSIGADSRRESPIDVNPSQPTQTYPLQSSSRRASYQDQGRQHSRSSSYDQGSVSTQVDPRQIPQERIQVRPISMSRPPIPAALTGVGPGSVPRQQETAVYPRNYDTDSGVVGNPVTPGSTRRTGGRLRRLSGLGRGFGSDRE